MSIRLGRPGAAKATGFTLVEMMITMAILSILSAVAYPTFRGLQDATETRSAARAIVLALKGAQQRASSLNRPAVAFFPDATHLSLYVDLDLDGAPDLPGEATAIRAPGLTTWNGYPSYEVPARRSLSTAAFPVGSLGKPQVTLRSDGTVSAGGSVTLLDARGSTYRIDVTPTGAVGLSRQDGA